MWDLTLIWLFAKRMNGSRLPKFASVQISAFQGESNVYSSTLDSLNMKPQLVLEFGRGQVSQVANGIYSERSHLCEAEVPPGRQFTVSQGNSQTLNYCTQLPNDANLPLVQLCR